MGAEGFQVLRPLPSYGVTIRLTSGTVGGRRRDAYAGTTPRFMTRPTRGRGDTPGGRLHGRP